jgi:YVTN family beta-propeller protein
MHQWIRSLGLLVCVSVLGLFGCANKASSTAPAVLATPTPLNSGRFITPATQSSQDVGNFPVNMAISPDGRYAIVSDIGYHQFLWSIRLVDGVGVSHIDFKNHHELDEPAATTRPGNGEGTQKFPQSWTKDTYGLYYGLAISQDNVIYAAGGGHDTIEILKLDEEGNLATQGEIKTRKWDFPAGLAMDGRGILFVANNASGNEAPTKLSGSLATIDPSTQKELGRYTFSASHGGTSNFPLALAVLNDGSKCYLASERDDCVYVLDTRDPAKPALLATVPTGSRPDAVALSHDEKRIFVANSLSDTISVIDTSSDAVVRTILLRPSAARDLPGVTPTGLCVSADDRTLYATLGDMNAVAVIDLVGYQLEGYIPAGWYPTAVAVDGDQLLVVNARGTRVRNPNNYKDPLEPKRAQIYVLSVLQGNVCRMDIPQGSALRQATQQVLANSQMDRLSQPQGNPLAGIGLAAGGITHVVYIIKENRTYDQVLGDDSKGDGDPSLVLFGKDITPNLHALADRFVLLDNLYACGDVSGDGWDWSTQGMVDAYVARNVPYNYGGRGRKFDFEGQNNGYVTGGYPADDDDDKPVSKEPEFRNGAPAIPDVANTGRNLWDTAKEAGISMRNWGFFLTVNTVGQGTPKGPDNYPTAAGLQPPGHDLAGITDIDFRRFDLEYPDSDAPMFYFHRDGAGECLFGMHHYGKAGMASRFAEWNREFQMMLKKDPKGGAVPALMFVRFPMDHTEGARGGEHTPKAYVADNDYAVGQIVDAISHSAIWPHCAIFVIEDDAQSGADHVDAHRTTGYVISPWIKAGSVDHRFNNTDTMLKTMELILGLKPLCQYDAVAEPILDWDTGPNNSAPYDAIMPSEDLIGQINPRKKELKKNDPRVAMVERSDAMDFTHADAAPALELDDIIWKTVKGAGSEMPPPRGVSAGTDQPPDADRDGD